MTIASRIATLATSATAIPVALSAATSSYLGIVTLAAVARPRSAPDDGDGTTRFAVLVPAHDEERLIAATVRRLLEMDYPVHNYRVHVIADHCSDQTARRASDAGATVHEHDDPEPRGKGAALRWAMAKIGADADVVVIIDADTEADDNLLRALDARMARGVRVVQTNYAVKAPESSTAVALRYAALAVRHHLRPLGRVSLGASCGLFGNGMAFHRDVLDAAVISDHLTEDLELGCELVLAGELIDFAPEAIVRAEMPDTLSASNTQHERWERGRLDVAKRYSGRLLRSALREGSRRPVARLDAAADLMIPPLSVNVAFSLVTTGGASVLALVTGRRSARRLAIGSTVSTAVLVGHVLVALRLAKAPRAVYVSLLAAPRVVWWKVALWCRMLLGRSEVAWERTARNES